MSLPEIVEKLTGALEAANLMLATAESCTGGMIASAMTDRAGSSRVFDRGFITYSYQSKTEILAVPEKLLAQHGAVSTECVTAMLKGALMQSPADIVICTSGIAGPSGGTVDKPVGTVYIGVIRRGSEPIVERHHFDGDRAGIRLGATIKALEMAYALLRP